MFDALGRLLVRRRRLTLALFVVALAVAGVLGAGVFTRLQAAGFDDPGSGSAQAAQVLRDRFGVSDPVAVLVVEPAASSGRADDPATATAAASLQARLQGVDGVTQVVSYWSSGRQQALRSTDGRAGEMVVSAAATAGDARRDEVAKAVRDLAAGPPPGLRIAVGGRDVVNAAITDRIRADLARAEAIAIPVTTILLILVFGSMVSAGLPLVVGVGAIVGSFLTLWLVTLTTDVSVFALNLVTGLGMGLGIDYALLVVNRFREELARLDDVEQAVVRTVATAGRTVFVSGLTVAVTLGALTLFPQYFLRSFGYAGVAVTLLAVASALVALPAVLALLGHRVDALKVRRGTLAPSDVGVWSRVARGVMRRPWPVLLVVVAALGVVAAPAASVVFGQVDARALPASDPAARASAELADRFSGNASTPVDVVVPGGAADPARLAAYAAALSRLDGVTSVLTPASVVAAGRVVAANPAPDRFAAGPDARLSMTTTVPARGTAALDFVDSVRGVPSGFSGVLVGGAAALFADSQHAIGDTLPLVGGWIALTTLLVLFAFTGSVVLPVKALLLNVLSLGSTLGLVVWVFQEGHLTWLTGDFTVTGSVDTGMAVLIGVTAFALSMDYEVFLLARIKEEHDAGRSTTEAVALGLQRSGRIISAAAVLLAIVFAAFVSSGVTNIKQLGIGVAFAILVDATVVRGLLVPALMRVLGGANWWAPAPLRLVYRRIGLREA